MAAQGAGALTPRAGDQLLLSGPVELHWLECGALEPAHALAHVMRIAPKLASDHLLVMNMCGRGDKDVFTVANALGIEL